MSKDSPFENFPSGVKMPARIGRLKDLEKLSLIDAGDEDGVVAELANLTRLRKLGIRRLLRENGAELCAAIEKMGSLRSLTLSSVKPEEALDLQCMSTPPPLLERLFLAGILEELPRWLASLRSIVKIELIGSKLKDDPFAVLQTLPCLMDLSLIESYAGKHLCCTTEGFKKLRILHLCRLHELESVSVEKGAMPVLEKLSIWHCTSLGQVPSGIEHLSYLQHLHMLGMHDEFVERLRKGRGVDWNRVEHISVINSTTYLQSKDGDWSAFINEDLSICDVPSDEEEDEDEEEQIEG